MGNLRIALVIMIPLILLVSGTAIYMDSGSIFGYSANVHYGLPQGASMNGSEITITNVSMDPTSIYVMNFTASRTMIPSFNLTTYKPYPISVGVHKIINDTLWIFIVNQTSLGQFLKGTSTLKTGITANPLYKYFSTEPYGLAIYPSEIDRVNSSEVKSTGGTLRSGNSKIHTVTGGNSYSMIIINTNDFAYVDTLNLVINY